MSIYNHEMMNIDGDLVSLEQYKGKVLLVVNTASKCGLTPQYEGLEALYKAYQNEGLEILGFPSNQFAAQEPGDNTEVKKFCSLNFGVSFPLFGKIDVRGENAHPLFKELSEEKPFQGFDMDNQFAAHLHGVLAAQFPEILEGNGVKWNFNKFLIDRDGNVVERFEPYVEPKDLEEAVKALL